MSRKILLFALTCTALFLSQATIAQQDDNTKKWYQLDEAADGYNGISLAQTYKFLQGKKSTPIIVAVIDSGVDTTHEDLKNILWTNKGEIPGNGIDDDHNGYVDDIHGWNFLGNKNGTNLSKDVDERTRVYYHFKEKFDGKEIDTSKLTADEKWQYREWQKASAQMTVDPDEKTEVLMLDVLCKSMKKNDAVIREEMQKEEYTPEELVAFEPATQKGKQAKMGYITCLKMLNTDDDQTNVALLKDLQEYVDGKKQSIENKISAPKDFRAEAVGDDYYNINDRYYGNNDIMGPDPMHGTFVTGLIGAARNNKIGIDGIADNVQVMMLRAVPDGDEYDKDIALAIIYAVNNGAKVINMSFGKSFSPEKKWVDEAIRYAASRDVLLVHAAGNESHNIDSVDNFPNPYLMEFNNLKAPNFITVGASGDKHVAQGKAIADFSNYGKGCVDVFAPGVKIYSTLPGGNQYGYLNGTSFSSPIVAGIAALIRSYYPQLSAEQVKFAIDKSGEESKDTAQVNVPGADYTTTLSALCSTGGYVNAEKALEIAAGLKPEAKKIVPPKTDNNIFVNPTDTKN